MSDCLFCKIIAGDVQSEKVYEDEHAIAFLDIHPVAPGHTLVIPKVHAENYLDLPDSEVGPLGIALKNVTTMVKEALGPAGFNIGANMLKAAGQAIDHLHIHIIPRWDDDGGGSMHSIVKNPPTEDMQEIADKIRNVA